MANTDNVIAGNTHPTPANATTALQADELMEIAAMKNLKIPPFWKANPALWFFQIEAQFHNNRIISDNSRFNAIIASLDPEVLNEVSDLVQKPPSQDKYAIFKSQLVARFTESKERQLNRLLTSLELGDKRPSSLLREMRRLAGDTVPDDMLSTIWMSRMPNHVRAILSASQHIDLNALSEIADKIMDNMTSNAVFATEACDDNKISSDLDRRLKDIESTLASLTALVGRSSIHPRSRSRSKPRTRSTSSRAKSRDPNTSLCYFHRKFGDKAINCKKPCNFISKN